MFRCRDLVHTYTRRARKMGAYQRMAATKNDLDRCHPENKSELYNLLAHARHQARKQCGCVGISKA